jgi:hypothetical protein
MAGLSATVRRLVSVSCPTPPDRRSDAPASLHTGLSPSQVHVLPAKGQSLAAAETGTKDEAHHGLRSGGR